MSKCPQCQEPLPAGFKVCPKCKPAARSSKDKEQANEEQKKILEERLRSLGYL